MSSSSLLLLSALLVTICAQRVIMIYDLDTVTFSAAVTNDVVAKLRALNLTVELHSARVSTPSRALLQSSTSAMFVWTGLGGFANADAVGDLLADFVDGGGLVVTAHNARIGGRFLSSGMLAIPQLIADANRARLVPVRSDHRLLAGVNSFDGGDRSVRSVSLEPSAGADLIAKWTTGEPLIAVFDEKFTGTIVSLGFYPLSSDFAGGGNEGAGLWISSTNGAQMMLNALSYRPVRRGQLCGRSDYCATRYYCVDKVCCESPCNGPCESCDQPGRQGTCLPVCAEGRAGCASSQCGKVCTDLVQGWLNTSCRVFVGAMGVCAPNAYQCLKFNLTACAAMSDTESIAACASGGCMRRNTCVFGSARATSDTVSKICFTSADAADADSCPGVDERCDDSGACVVPMSVVSMTRDFLPHAAETAHVGAIVGGIVGGVAALVLVVVVVYFVKRRLCAGSPQNSTKPGNVNGATASTIVESSRQYDSVPVSRRFEFDSNHYSQLTKDELG
jgi:hypothetical protein